MEAFEKLGVFYLGREYGFGNQAPKESLLLYDSKDLVTHAVCVGMTGSGKTGLCIGLLEEAAIDGIPSIVVDPKGDLANLLLTFPSLRPEDFLPWVNEDDARKKGLSVEEFAQNQAELWKKGLAGWNQDGARIQRLRDAAEFMIYTPGSSAGIPISIMQSFAAPPPAIVKDHDLLRDSINTTVTSLLDLLGIEADPIQSREHILLSTILDAAWRNGQNLNLETFIELTQSPPVAKIGAFELESFFPSKDRFSLAMRINNLLAAPGFSAWLEGEPLALNSILYTEQGKPRVSIFSIAHLTEPERMFFVSLLLNQVLGWIRTQSGTTSLRALLYMDEIFGYFPPVANPPSKGPLLTLLKQARAFGLGIVLATQNPMDLDYKGLSNIGTWFIGRLQTERDKARVVEGLTGAATSAGGRFDRQALEQVLSGLGNRIFLMNDVHEDAPVFFETRWVMSYLCGPLTRNQIKQLMDAKRSAQPMRVDSDELIPPAPCLKKTVPPSQVIARPVLPPEIPQYFVPATEGGHAEGHLFYEPMLLGIAQVYYADAKNGISTQEQIAMLAEMPEAPANVAWGEAQQVRFSENDLDKFPDGRETGYGELPKDAVLTKNYRLCGKALHEWLYRNRKIDLLRSPFLLTTSQPGEAERDFRIRRQVMAHEKRDALIERIRTKYAPKITNLEDRIRRAEQAVEREKEQAQQQKLQTAVSLGATILGALFGRKKLSQSTLGRASTTAGRAGRILKESKDIERAVDNVDELRRQLAELQHRLTEEAETATKSADPLSEKLEALVLKPKKKDISVSLLALAWAPYWQTEKGGIEPAWS